MSSLSATATEVDRSVGPGLGPTTIVNVPFPLPDVPLGKVTHGALVAATQLHPAGAVTLTTVFPPWLLSSTTEFEREKLQMGPPAAWVTVMLLLPTLTAPLLEVIEVFAATVSWNGPLPSAVGDPTEIQSTSAWANHLQPAEAVTFTVSVLEALVTVKLDWFKVVAQGLSKTPFNKLF